MSYKLLLVAGVSGSGKDYLVDSMIARDDSPYLLMKLKQVTTRPMRDYESQDHPYKFLTNEEYNQLEPDLIAKTHIGENQYGTLLPDELDEDIVYILIVNFLGFQDLYMNSYSKFDEIMGIIVTSNHEDPREGRDLQKEKSDLGLMKIIMEDKCEMVENNYDEEHAEETTEQTIQTIYNLLDKHFGSDTHGKS